METIISPVEMTKEGQRHIAVGEYSTAVEVLAKACELLAKEHGDTGDECAAAYFWYGKALLALSREERGILGGVIENTTDKKCENDADEMNGDNKDMEDNAKSSEESEVEKEDGEEKEKEMDVDPAANEEEKEGDAAEDKAGDEQPENEDEVEGSDEDEEDDVDNLQLAWEMLELSRSILNRRVESKTAGTPEESMLAEVYLCLGEVALESETYDKAVGDMQSCLEIQKKLYQSNDRRIAETHYQIGLANSLSSNFDEAVTHFNNAVNILQTCIKKHQDMTPTNDMIQREIKQLEELIPEIQEKIQDMIDCKAETVNLVREKMCSTNGAGPSTSANGAATSSTNGIASSSSDKKASDISHLVKRKRKASETEEVAAPKRAA